MLFHEVNFNENALINLYLADEIANLFLLGKP